MELIHFKKSEITITWGGIALALGEFGGLHRAHQSLIGARRSNMPGKQAESGGADIRAAPPTSF